jgi:hypothetical protein
MAAGHETKNPTEKTGKEEEEYVLRCTLLYREAMS